METIEWSDFEKIDIRVGTIIEACIFEKAKKPAYQLIIDFGPLGTKKSSAQITKKYTPSELIGQQVVAIINFPPKQIANFMSQCLVLGAMEEQTYVTLLSCTHPVPNGSKIA